MLSRKHCVTFPSRSLTRKTIETYGENKNCLHSLCNTHTVSPSHYPSLEMLLKQFIKT